MHEEDRIILEPCGCRMDAVTGLRVALCAAHEHSDHLALASELRLSARRGRLSGSSLRRRARRKDSR